MKLLAIKEKFVQFRVLMKRRVFASEREREMEQFVMQMLTKRPKLGQSNQDQSLWKAAVLTWFSFSEVSFSLHLVSRTKCGDNDVLISSSWQTHTRTHTHNFRKVMSSANKSVFVCVRPFLSIANQLVVDIIEFTFSNVARFRSIKLFDFNLRMSLFLNSKFCPNSLKTHTHTHTYKANLLVALGSLLFRVLMDSGSQ